MDIEKFRIPTQADTRAAEVPPQTPPRKQQVEPFLRGPVPLWWLSRAASAGSSGLSVGLCLWFMRGVTKSGGPIKVSRGVLKKMNLSRDQSRRGLQALQRAGLVRFVVSGRGHCPVVEILVDESVATEEAKTRQVSSLERPDPLGALTPGYHGEGVSRQPGMSPTDPACAPSSAAAKNLEGGYDGRRVG